jgi:hypothetical protein
MQLQLIGNAAAVPIRAFTRDLQQASANKTIALNVEDVWFGEFDTRVEIALEARESRH